MKPKRTGIVVTAEMRRKAKPAAYTGLMVNMKTRSMKFVCWPACKIPKVGLVVLMKRQCKSKDEAVAMATRELQRRLKGKA